MTDAEPQMNGSDEVEVRLKKFGSCPCGCGLEGKYQVREYRDGTRHVIGCSPCRQCQGRRSKRTGGKAQRTARQLLAVPTSNGIKTGHEEHAAGLVRFEAKSGAQIRPLVTAFIKAEAQSEATRAIGDTRPTVVAALLHPEGKEAVVAFRARNDEQMRQTIYALAVQLKLIEP